jgi:hypothetical protein
MDRTTVLYSFSTLPGDPAAQSYCVVPGRHAKLTVTCVNNTASKGAFTIKVDGEQVSGVAEIPVDGIPPADLSRPDAPISLWMVGAQTSVPSNAVVKDFAFDCTGVPSRPVVIEVSFNGKKAFTTTAYPRTRVMDLSGDWQFSYTPVSRANVAGVEGWDHLDMESLTPDIWDGKWQTYSTPIALSTDLRKDAAWGVYRRLVYIPAEWQGTDILFRANNMGAPWGEGGTLNLIYVNGYPCGRLWINGECRVSPFLVFGGWNLIAVASFMPNRLPDPYLFVRSSPSPERMKPVIPARRPDGAFLLLSQRPTGQGITMPFISGVPEGDHRRTDMAVGGEHQFIYFAVADDFVKEPKTPVEVEIEYLDQGTGIVGLDYDSYDASAPINGAFKSAPTFTCTNTGKWLTHTFVLPDARFANREHRGSDFRLTAQGQDLRIRRVEVRCPHGN